MRPQMFVRHVERYSVPQEDVEAHAVREPKRESFKQGAIYVE